MLHTVIVILNLLSLLASTYASAEPQVFRGWKDLGVVEGHEFQGTELVVMRADNSQQCLRLCWLYTNCTMVTFYPHKLRCRLTNDWPYGDLQTSLVSNEEAVTVDMRSAEVDKPRLHGCDNRNCEFDELCVPVNDPDSYKCLPLGYKNCPTNRPNVPNSVSTMDGMSKVVYDCKDGYVKTGTDDVTTCDQATGQWSSIDVTCTFLDCGTPPEVDGAVSLGNDTFYNADVTYICFEAYVSTSSSMSITCQANNQWTSSPSPCKLVTCPEPTNVDNGNVQVLERIFVNDPPLSDADLDLAYGGVAVHSCNEGYQANKAEFRSECQPDGTWESTYNFNCSRVDCGRPPVFPNTWSSFNSTKFEATAVYKCVDGYENVTDATMELTCASNGTWSGPDVTCNIVDCGAPIEVKNANAVYYTTTYLSEANFTCNEPTFINPDSAQSRSCRENGHWSEEPIECISCGKPKEYPHAFFNITSLSVDYYVAKYYCEEGFLMTKVANHMCLPSSLEWMGPDAICEMVSCGEPPKIDNAAVISNGTYYNSIASYMCDKRFANRKNSSTTLTCRSEGWSNNLTEIECVKISCGPPPAVNNSFLVTNDNDVNGTVTYRCLEGYTLATDSNTRQCLSEGVWDNTPVKCDQLDCRSDPKDVPNATWQVEITDKGETRAIYSCMEGYELLDSGKHFVECVDGNWTDFGFGDVSSNISSLCERIECGNPPSINDSTRSSNGTMFKDVAIYTCHNGKSWTSECQSNGLWSMRNFLCESHNHSCGPPPILSRSTISNTDSFTTDATLNILGPGDVDNRISSLDEDGDDKSTGVNDNVSSGSPLSLQSSSGVGFTPGETVMYQCLEGYQTLDNKSSFVYNCSEDGHWKQEEHPGVEPDYLSNPNLNGNASASSPCIPVDCGMPPINANASVTVNITTYGSNATYTCEVGLKTVEGNNVTRTCKSDGNWSEETIRCEVDGCGPPPSYPNTIISSLSGTRESDKVIYECKTGFTVSFHVTPSLVCVKEMWVGTLRGSPCQLVDCGEPTSITNATVELTATTYGNAITYQCLDGYNEVGSGTKICGEDGSWVGDDSFYCRISINCKQPMSLSHGSFKVYGDLRVGSVVSYSCDSGYEHKEKRSNRTCLRNGLWSREPIECLKLECGSVPVIGNADYLLDLVDGVLRALYSCLPGFKITSGDRIIYCPDGKKKRWTGTQITCGVDPCFEPPEVGNATSISTSKENVTDVVYVCNEGFQHWWFDSRSCTQDNGWSQERVECRILDCGNPPIVFNANYESRIYTTYGSVVVYTCDSGFRFTTSNSKKICTERGVWSTDFVECTKNYYSCPEPPKKQFSTVKHDSLSQTSAKATYICDVGYTKYLAFFEVFCRYAKWRYSQHLYKCAPVTCPNPTPVINATVIEHNDTYGSQMSYMCDTDYKMVGSGTRTCQADGTWSNELTECFALGDLFCLEPPKVNNSALTVQSYAENATYSCLPGYTGGGTIFCHNGEWSPTYEIECAPLDCETPINFDDTTMIVYETTFGKRAIYECKFDLDQTRPHVSICNSSGEWSLRESPCPQDEVQSSETGFPCQQPMPTISNATMEILETNGLRYISFTCNQGYLTMSSSMHVLCIDGEWTKHDQYVCWPIGLCSIAPVVENADQMPLKTIQPSSTELYFSIHYECRSGYIGTGYIYCYHNVGWDPLPECDIVDCGVFPPSNDTDNPYVVEQSNGTTYLSQAVIACQRPFIGSENVSVCQENGRWSDINMNCLKPSCIIPPTINNGTLIPHPDLHKKLNYDASSPGRYDKVSLNSSSWEVECDALHQYLGDGLPVTCHLINDTLEEKWEGVDESSCVQNKWINPGLPFLSKIHWGKRSYFNKITMCVSGTYSGFKGESPTNAYLSMTAGVGDSYSNYVVRLRISSLHDYAYMETRDVADDVREIIVEKKYSVNHGQHVTMCGHAHLHNSTLVGFLGGIFLGVVHQPGLFDSVQYVYFKQNMHLEYMLINYDVVQETTTRAYSPVGNSKWPG